MATTARCRPALSQAPAVDTRPAVSARPRARFPLAFTSTDDSLDVWRQRVGPAQAGEQHAIQQFLSRFPRAPSDAEFQAQLDAPDYDPAQRIVMRRGMEIVGHARLQPMVTRLADQWVPATVVSELRLLPELEVSGCAQFLLEALESADAARRSAFCRAPVEFPQLFQKRGWFRADVGRKSLCPAHELLARLSRLDGPTKLDDWSGRDTRSGPLRKSVITVRTWRQVERAALVEIFNEYAQQFSGTTPRDDRRWQWLLARRAFDRILVAEEVDGSDSPRLIGYAAMRDSRIVELAYRPSRSEALRQLLLRIGTDALESNSQFVEYSGPLDCPAHAFLSPGPPGTGSRGPQRAVDWLRVGSVERLISVLAPTLSARVPMQGPRLPCVLRFDLQTSRRALVFTRRGVRWEPATLGRTMIRCRETDVAQMLLGQFDFDAALQTGQLRVSQPGTRAILQQLFPSLPWCGRTLEDWPAS